MAPAQTRLDLHGSGAGLAPVANRVAMLNTRYRHHGAVAVLDHALRDADLGRVALVSSFGAESVVLLHLVSVIAPGTPVIFIDTQMLFPETLTYQRQLADSIARAGTRGCSWSVPRAPPLGRRSGC